jgi:hypothetical protein
MRNSISLLGLALMLAAGAMAQTSGSGAESPVGTQTNSGDKQANAASASQDNSAISGDQATKPAGAKSSSIIGCLDGPDADGHYTLRSMQYRSGVEVLGPNDLGTAAGQKIKLTGEWAPGAESQTDTKGKLKRRFQAASFDLLADKCPPPTEITPISKAKQKQQKAAASQKADNNPQ